MMHQPKRRLISDIPISESPEFNFELIADALFEFILSAPPEAPFNVCISGTWGSGKTTLLRALERKIRFHTDARTWEEKGLELIPLWFEPWKLDEEDVLIALVNLVLQHIENHSEALANARIDLERKEVFRLVFRRLLNVDPDELSNYYQWSARAKGSFLEIESLFRKVASAYLDSDKSRKKIVVFVDDLDRCPPKRIMTVFEAVKLFFDMPGFVFLFALDRQQIERAVTACYDAFDENDARTYLEKLFQLTYTLPQKEVGSLARYVSSTLGQMGLSIQQYGLIRALIETFGRNLRNLKLFLNAFSFQRYLMESVSDSKAVHDDEVLFKWLYLETVLPRSLQASIRRKSLALVLALEFLAQGALLHDPQRYDQYMQILTDAPIQYVPLIIYSLLPIEASDGKLDDDRLNQTQRDIVEDLRRDRGVLKTFEVLREGYTFLIDQDLSHFAYLSFQEQLSSTPRTLESRSQHEQGSRKRRQFQHDIILADADEWGKLGDSFMSKALFRAGYLCYLMATLMEYRSTLRLTDLASSYFHNGRTQAALALYREAYSLEISSPPPYVRLLYASLATHFDIRLRDTVTGTLLYRKALVLGSQSSSITYNLAFNLWEAGEQVRAFYHALVAYKLDPGDAPTRKRAGEFAEKLGKSHLSFDEWNDALERELVLGVENGFYPYPLTQEEEQFLQDFMRRLPGLSDVGDEIRSMPV